MLENRSIAVFLAMVLFAAPIRSQSPALQSPAGAGSTLTLRSPESPSAPEAAERFREIARELVDSKSITGPQADQAIILLTAARSLDRTAADIEPLMLQAAIRHGQRDYSDQVLLWLQSYVSESANRAIVMDAIKYLLDRLDSSEQRKAMLETLVKRIGNKNIAVDSELATLLGLLMLEKADKEAAKFYLLQAYTNNKYNKVAFSRLAELAPNEIGPAIYLEHLRLVLRENPLDINAAVGFSQYCERLQLYDLAAQSYQYCAELFGYLYPSEPLPPHVYLPWAICCYNSQGRQQVCLQIAASIRNAGQFDMLLEAIAGKAAAKAGNPGEAQQIFIQAEQRAERLLESAPALPQAAQQDTAFPAVQVNAKQIAWFYCFANIDPTKAIVWAHRAYAVEPNSPSAGSLLAYALSMNNDLKSAKRFLEVFEHTQIADLAQARVQAAEGGKAAAVQTLRAAIAKDAGSLAAETAKEMLRQLGSEYVPPVHGEMLMTYLTQNLGKTVAPQFLPPDKIIEVQFSVRGSDFSYGNDFDGVVTIVNKGTEPLVLTPAGLFQGNLRVSAQISGDIRKEIPDLWSQTVRTELIVPPGRSLAYTARLSTGELRRVLVSHPQAALDIQFTLYLDPVGPPEGAVGNRLVDVKPVTIAIKRPAVEITPSYVRGVFNTVSSGQPRQRIQAARLFTGLLKEQQVMAEQGTLYPYRYAAWLPELLRASLISASGLLLSQGQDDWVVKVNTMADLLALQIDQELATTVAKNLNDPQWPVRLMAVYLLASSTGEKFHAVLDWIAQQDSNELVRSIAMSLQSAPASAVSAGSSAAELATISR